MTDEHLFQLHKCFYGVDWVMDMRSIVTAGLAGHGVGKNIHEEALLSYFDDMFQARSNLILKCILFIRKMPEEELSRFSIYPDFP